MQHSDWRLIDEPESPGDKDLPVDWTHIFDEDWGEGSETDADKETAPKKPLEAPGDDAGQQTPSDVAQAAEENSSTPQARAEPTEGAERVEAENPFVHPALVQKADFPRQAFAHGMFQFPSHLPTDTPRLHPIPSPGLPIPSPIATASSSQQSYFMPITDLAQPHATTVSTSLSREIKDSEETNEHTDTVLQTGSQTTVLSERVSEIKPTVAATAADQSVAEIARTAVDHELQDRESPAVSAESTAETTRPPSKAGYLGDAMAENLDEYDIELSHSKVGARKIRENYEKTARYEVEGLEDNIVVDEHPGGEHMEGNEIVDPGTTKDDVGRNYAEAAGNESSDAGKDEVEEDDRQERAERKLTAEESREGGISEPQKLVSDENDNPAEQTGGDEKPAYLYDSKHDEEDDDEDDEEGVENVEEDEVDDSNKDSDSDSGSDSDEESEEEEEERLYGARYEEDDESDHESESDSVDDVSPSQHQPKPKNLQPQVIVLDSDSEDEAPPVSRTDSVAPKTGNVPDEQESVSSPSLGSEHSSSEDSVDSENEDWSEAEYPRDTEDAEDHGIDNERLKKQPPEQKPDDLSEKESSGAQPLEKDEPEEEMSQDEEVIEDVTNMEVVSDGNEDDKQPKSEHVEDESVDEEMKDGSESESESESEDDEVVLLDQTDYGRPNGQWVENQHQDNEPRQPEQTPVKQAPEQNENTEQINLFTSGANYPDEATSRQSHEEQHDVTEPPHIPEQDSPHRDVSVMETVEEARTGGEPSSRALELAIDPELYTSGPGREEAGQEEATNDSFQGDKQDDSLFESREETTEVPKFKRKIDYSLILDGAAPSQIPAGATTTALGSASYSQPLSSPSSPPLIETHQQFLSVSMAAESLPTPEPTQEKTSRNNEKPLSTHVELPTSQSLNDKIKEEDSDIEASSVSESREGSQEIDEPSMPSEIHTSAEVQSLQADFALDHDARNALDDISLVGVDRHYPGLRSKLSYFAPLATLVDHYDSLIDTISAVTEVRPVIRASSGRKDYMLTLQLTDPSMAGTTHFAQIFRPFKAALPSVSEGDAVLLRNFKVKSFNRSMMLLSASTSAWAVFNGQNKTLVEGPPVEYGKEEQTYATDMRQWYQENGMAMVADAQLQASIERAGREGTPASSVALSDSESIDSAQRNGERGESSVSNLSSRRNRKSHRRITIHELRDGRRYTEVGSPSGKENIHELRDGTVYANL